MTHASTLPPVDPLAYPRGLVLSSPAAGRAAGGTSADNPADKAGTSEICACCNGVLDIDELVGLLPLAKGSEHTHPAGCQTSTHSASTANHSHAQPRWLALMQLYLALPGCMFGWQNMRAAKTAHKDIGDLGAFIDQRLAAVQPVSQGPAPRLGAAQAAPQVRDPRLANLAAYKDTAIHSQSMQSFIYWFAGLLSMVQAGVMIGAIWLPSLEPLGLVLLAIYAGSFAVRYFVYERPRFKAAAAALSTEGLPQLAQAGLQLVRDRAVDRRKLFATAGTLFAVYSGGAFLAAVAGMHKAARLGALPGLDLFGRGCLLIGTLAVTYLNNGPIKDTFGKSQDAHVGREELGSLKSTLFRLGYVQQQLAALEHFEQQVRQLPQPSRRSLVVAADISVEWGLTALSYATFGGTWRLMTSWQHKRRIREAEAKSEGGKALVDALVDRLTRLALRADNERAEYLIRHLPGFDGSSKEKHVSPHELDSSGSAAAGAGNDTASAGGNTADAGEANFFERYARQTQNASRVQDDLVQAIERARAKAHEHPKPVSLPHAATPEQLSELSEQGSQRGPASPEAPSLAHAHGADGHAPSAHAHDAPVSTLPAHAGDGHLRHVHGEGNGHVHDHMHEGIDGALLTGGPEPVTAAATPQTCSDANCHDHDHDGAWARLPPAAAVLHAVRYGLVTHKRYEYGALLDHTQALLRLAA